MVDKGDALSRVSSWVRELTYLEKWLLLGGVIGVASSIAALLFLWLLVFMIGTAAWILGVVDHPLEWSISDFTLLALMTNNRALIPALVVLGALASALIVYNFEPTAEGPGVNAAIRAYHRGAAPRARLPFVKAVASAIFLGFGGSGGVQGPAIQIGAGIGSIIARLLKLSVEDRRIAMVAGMAGTLSAIFCAPIGAALFAVEVLYRRDIETEALAPALISSVISYVVALHIVGYHGVFPAIKVPISAIYSPTSVAAYAILCVASGLLARLYILIINNVRKLLSFVDRKWPEKPWLRPVIGAIVVACIGTILPAALGGGVSYAAQLIVSRGRGPAIHGIEILEMSPVASMLLIIASKIVVTAFSVGSGGSGGLFAPSIFIGALLGLLIGMTIGRYTPLDSCAYAYIGMASFFGAATKTPIASSFMIAEMSRSYPLLIPALFTSLIANELVRGQTLYEAQLPRRIRPELTSLAMLLTAARETEARAFRVKDIVNAEYVAVRINDIVSKALELMARKRQRVLPVIDTKGRAVGAIDAASLRKALEAGVDVQLELLDLASPPIVHTEDPLSLAIEEMMRKGFDYAIAVDENGCYAGTLLVEDIAITLAQYIALKSER